MSMKTKQTKKTGRPARFTYSTPDGTRHLMKGRQRVQSFIPEDVARKLKIIAAAEVKAFSDVISEALEKFVANHKALRKAV